MEKQNNKPSLRFPDHTDDWQMKKVGALTERISNPVDVQDDELYNQIGIRSHGKGIFYKEAVTGKSLGNKRVFWIKENTFIVNIVFAWEQAVAKTTEKEIGMIASHRFPMYLPVDNQSNLDYLLHFFLTRKGKSLLELASPGGAGRNKTLGQKEFENLKFLVPDVAEQTKIAAFLTTIDKKITELKQKKTLLEEYKKGVMQKIFDVKADGCPSLRFKDENGKEFPKWIKKKLKDVGSFIGGGTPSKTDITFWKGNIPWLSSSDLSDDSIYQISLSRFISSDAISESATKIVPPKSILIVSRVGVGKVAVNEIELCTSQDFTSLIVDTDHYIFLAYLIKFKTNQLLSFNQGTSIKGFLKSDLENLQILLPLLEEQTIIANFLSAIDEKINNIQTQLIQTQQWKKGLLQKMFV